MSADTEAVYVAMGAVADGTPMRVGSRRLGPGIDGVVGVRIGHDGDLLDVHVFEGESAVDSLNGSILTIESWSTIEVAGAVYEAPAREAVFGMPMVAVAVELGPTAQVVAAAPDVESARTWPLVGDQLLMACKHRDETDETSTELQLVVGLRPLWSTSVPDREVTAVLQTPGDTWVALGGGTSRSEVRRLDLKTGGLSEPIISIPPARGHDLSISVLTDGPRAWGSREGMFVASAASFELMLYGRGHVADVDERDALVDVYHLEPERGHPTVEETGLFVLRDGASTRVGPTSTYATLTPTHVVHASACDGSPCIRAVRR